MSAWSVVTDIGMIYVTHKASLDMLIIDRVTGEVVENDLSGRTVPAVVEADMLSLIG